MQIKHPEEDKVVIWIGPFFAACLYYGPDSTREIWEKDNDFPKDFTYQCMKWCRGGIIMINGEEHKKMRKLLQPAFQPQRLNETVDFEMNYYNKLMVQDMAKRILNLQKSESSKSGPSKSPALELDFHDYAEPLFLDIVAKSMLERDLNAMSNKENNKLVEATRFLTHYVIQRFWQPIMWSETTLKIFRKDFYDQEIYYRNVLHEYVGDILAQKLKDAELMSEEEILSQSKSLINILVQGYRNKEISKKDVIAQACTFLFTGSDTNSISLRVNLR